MELGTLARRLLLQFDLSWVARGCRQHFIDLDQRQEDALIQSLVEHYYLGKGKGDPRSSPDLKVDFDDAIYGTVMRNRATVIPWLNSIQPLAGMRILEVGTGAGGSIVPLAEQGAYVVGTDVDIQSLAVAKERLRIYGLNDSTELHLTNATELGTTFRGQQFNAVIFFASLEHMTLEERWNGLPAAWSLLDRGGRLVIIETPNQLWWYRWSYFRVALLQLAARRRCLPLSKAQPTQGTEWARRRRSVAFRAPRPRSKLPRVPNSASGGRSRAG